MIGIETKEDFHVCKELKWPLALVTIVCVHLQLVCI